jgi:hypothetical protein
LIFMGDLVNLYMTTIQLKSEINKTLDKVPENVLPDILDYLKQIEAQSSDHAKLTSNFKKILLEDKGLLERLAK